MAVFTIVTVVATAVIATIGVLAHLLANKRRRLAHLPGPPLPSFWLGHALLIEEKLNAGGSFEQTLLDFSKEYGGVFVLWLGHMEYVSVSEFKASCKIIRDTTHLKPPRLFRSAAYPFGYRYLGCLQEGSNDMEKWARRQKGIAPFYSKSNVRDLNVPFNQAVDKFIAYVDQAAQREEFLPMGDTFALLVSLVVNCVAFAAEADKLEDMQPVLSASQNVVLAITEQVVNPFAEYLPSISFRRMVKEKSRFVRETFAKWVQKRQEKIMEGGHYGNDLLGRLLEATAINGEYKAGEIVDIGLEHFLASHNQTSYAFAFALKEILKHPEVEKRLVEEVDRVLEGRQFVSPTDLSSLHYLNCVMKETLRRHPPVSVINRSITSDVTVDGYVIPAGTKWVSVSVYGIHLNETYWPDPFTFNPDRFTSLTGDADSDVPFLPFSSGRRMCVGRAFAEQELTMGMARLFQMFTMQLDEESLKCDRYKTGVIFLQPDEPVNCKFKRRLEK